MECISRNACFNRMKKIFQEIVLPGLGCAVIGFVIFKVIVAAIDALK